MPGGGLSGAHNSRADKVGFVGLAARDTMRANVSLFLLFSFISLLLATNIHSRRVYAISLEYTTQSLMSVSYVNEICSF